MASFNEEKWDYYKKYHITEKEFIALSFNEEKLNYDKRDYPTESEFFEEITKIRAAELKSERYMLAYTFLANNYWNRKNKHLEDELFKIIGTYGLESSFETKTYDCKKSARMVRLETLKQFMSLLTEKQINSNIFLKTTYWFMNNSIDHCSNIMNELYDKLNDDNGLKSVSLKLPIPDEMQKNIPDYIKKQVGIKFYRPEIYKIEYINVLDLEHIYVYEDYNTVADKIGKLAEDICLLQLNNMMYNITGLECYLFQICHSGHDNHFDVRFLIKTKQNNQMINEEKVFVPTEEFIQNTIINFKNLLDMGIVDISVLQDKNSQYILKKKNNETE